MLFTSPRPTPLLSHLYTSTDTPSFCIPTFLLVKLSRYVTHLMHRCNETRLFTNIPDRPLKSRHSNSNLKSRVSTLKSRHTQDSILETGRFLIQDSGREARCAPNGTNCEFLKIYFQYILAL